MSATTTYRAVMISADTGSEGRYDFTAEERLLDQPPNRVVSTFMDHVAHDLFPKRHLDYAINGAYKNTAKRVVTAMGSLHFDHDPDVPFLLMISVASEA